LAVAEENRDIVNPEQKKLWEESQKFFRKIDEIQSFFGKFSVFGTCHPEKSEMTSLMDVCINVCMTLYVCRPMHAQMNASMYA